MPRLIVLRGLPGSGKSTYADQLLTEVNRTAEVPTGAIKRLPEIVRVNKDLLREMLTQGRFFLNDNLVNNCMYQTIQLYLLNGISVISDNMNFQPYHLEVYFNICSYITENHGHEIEIEVHDFETPLEECIRRDSLRAKPVNTDNTIGVLYERFCLFNTDNGFPQLPDYISKRVKHGLT